MRLLGVCGVLVLERGASAARVRTEGYETLPPTRPPSQLNCITHYLSPLFTYTVSPTPPPPNLTEAPVHLFPMSAPP